MMKTIVISVILAVVGYLLVYFVGFGITENGALGVALGLFIGVLFGARDQLTENASADSSTTPSPSGTLSVFVGNLAYKTRGRQLASLFEPYGEIVSIRIVKDRETGKAKGFGFVEMHEADAKRAIKSLDGNEFMGRTLKVSEANTQKTELEN